MYCVQNSVQDEKASGGATKIIMYMYVACVIIAYTVRACPVHVP